MSADGIPGHDPVVPAAPAALRLRGRTFDAGSPAVMAIVNRTNDSFWAGNRHGDLASARRALDAAVELGADIVDVGGVRAGQEGEVVTPEQEIERVVPFLARAREDHPQLVLSLDTWRSEVARVAAAEAGLDLVAGVQGNAEHLAAAACAGGVASLFLPNAEAAGRWLRQNLQTGDVVLVKGSRGVHLERAIEILKHQTASVEGL